MFFIGYHGTSEASARNILSVGVQSRFLPPTGQIGPGFYVAKMNGQLPQWGAAQATGPGRAQLNRYVRTLCGLTGWWTCPVLPENVRPTILKVYATRHLRFARWSVMNEMDLHSTKAILYGPEGTGVDAERDAKWLQLVVHPSELSLLQVRRDDGVAERNVNWLAKESPI